MKNICLLLLNSATAIVANFAVGGEEGAFSRSFSFLPAVEKMNGMRAV